MSLTLLKSVEGVLNFFGMNLLVIQTHSKSEETELSKYSAFCKFTIARVVEHSGRKVDISLVTSVSSVDVIKLIGQQSGDVFGH